MTPNLTEKNVQSPQSTTNSRRLTLILSLSIDCNIMCGVQFELESQYLPFMTILMVQTV